jgi:hypothetical protein
MEQISFGVPVQFGSSYPSLPVIIIRIQVFDQNLKNLQVKKFNFLINKCTILFLGLHKDFPSYRTLETFSPLKRTSSTSKYDIYIDLFLFLWVTFVFVDSDPI